MHKFRSIVVFFIAGAAALLLAALASAASQPYAQASYSGQLLIPIPHLAQPGRHRVSDALAAPAVMLSVTVGIDPSACAPMKTIRLPFVGGDATYCYRISNTGSVTLTRHTLIDDRLGTVLSDYDFPLPPDTSAYVLQTEPITRSTWNTAVWTANNPETGDIVEAQDGATVYVGYPTYLPLVGGSD